MMFLSSVSAGHLQSRVRCHVYSLCMAFLCLLGTERCALPCLGLIPGWHATTRYLLGLHFTVVLSPASQSFCIVIVVAFMDLCIVLLDVMTITCIAIDLLLSSYLFPFLPLSFLPMPSSAATCSFVGGHCLAYSCLGVFIQFCCFSPCIWLEVRPWPPLHHHGVRKHPCLLSALSCFQGYGSPTKHKNQDSNIYINIYIYIFAK